MRPPARAPGRPPASRRLLAPLVLAMLCACGEAPPRLGATPAEAQHHVGEALGALASRLGPAEREPAYDALRTRLIGSSLVPSRLFDDDSLWTERAGETRGVGLTGYRAAGRYRIGVREEPARPAGPADYRGRLSLRRRGSGEYEWTSAEELGLGPLSVEGLADATTSIVRAAETGPAGDFRPRMRSLLPRTAEALGRGTTLEVLRLERDAAGATEVVADARLDLDALALSFPHYAAFLRRDSLAIRFRLELADDAGGTFWVVDGQDGRYTLRARIGGGRLVRLEGPPRPLPERLRLRLDFTGKAGFLRYGFTGLEGDLRLPGRAGERGVEVSFRREPAWVVPFLVRPFLRASLRRPFEGEGAQLAFALREDGSGLTLVGRDYRVLVKESWLVRWFGANAGGTVARFRESAEPEADRFTAEALLALRADLVALLQGGPAPPHRPRSGSSGRSG